MGDMKAFSSSFPPSSGGLQAEIIAYDRSISSQIVDAWRDAALRAGGVRSPCEGPDWTWFRQQRQFLTEPTQQLAILYNGSTITSVTPLMNDMFRFKGGWFRKTLAGLRSSGSEFLLPSSPAAYQSFIEGMFRASDIDYVRIRAPNDDAFVNFLIESKRGRDWFLFIPPQENLYFHWIDLTIGREGYWARFKKKQRYNFNRELKALSSIGPVEFKRVSSVDDVADFATAALAVGEKSWQYRIKDRIANTIEQTKLEYLLKEMSDKNMLRSYFLRVGGQYVCFWTAFQHSGTFWLYDTGFDPKFSSYSPGKCMLQLIINDLFDFQTPRYLSFGHAPGARHYKALFATDYRRAADVLAVRNTPINRAFALMYRVMNGQNSLPCDDSPHEYIYAHANEHFTD